MKFKFLSLNLFLMLAIFLVVLGWLAESKTFETVSYKSDKYVGVSLFENGTAQSITGPILVNKVEHSIELESLNISFKFMTQEPTFSYGNLFQTGDSLDAIRMELQPASNLILIFGNGKLFSLSDAIKINTYHKITLDYEREKYLKVFIDGKEALNVIDKRLLSGNFDLSNLVVGTGLASQRTLAGVVNDFSFNASFSYVDMTAIFSRWILILLCGSVFLKSLPVPAISKNINQQGVFTASANLFCSISIYGFSLVFISVGLYLIYLSGEQHLGLSKWIVHLLLPVSLVVLLAIMNFQKSLWKTGRWLFGSVFLAYVIYILQSTLNKQYLYDYLVLGMIVFSLLAFVLIFSMNRSAVKLQTVGTTAIMFIVPVGSILYLSLSWATLVELTNWHAFRHAYDNNFAITMVGAFLVLRVVFFIVFQQDVNNKSVTHKQDFNVRSFFSRFYLDIASISILFWMSFRHDSLFIPGSEYHWEYYVGVVQGIWNGGWLLWDTPSQYGFLNILLASLVPTDSAWESFYLFQGTLLFLVSTAIYFTARLYVSGSILQRLALFSILFMALFYADPELIGPFPFPSSSVVRFFCVYALVIVVLLMPKFGLRQAIVFAAVWPLAVIWSAESAIYAIAIFIFILFVLFQTKISFRKRAILAGQYVALSGVSLLVIAAGIGSFYYVKLGVLPDVFGFYEHAVGYAGGFGYVPFPITGPGNLLLLIFMALCVLCISIVQRNNNADEKLLAPFAAMAGCIWGVSTYYIGRPVPQNITAMLPIITMVVYFSLILSNRMENRILSIPIKSAAIPLFFLLLIPLFNQKWIDNIFHTESFSANVTTKLPQATTELHQLLTRIGASKNTPVVYYGDDAAPPVLSANYSILNGTNWLPIPLQLLEQPVTESRRSLYINRYICRIKPNEGVLINRKSQAIEIRLQGFLNEIREFYNAEEMVKGDVYNVYRFSNINLKGCTTFVGNKI